jgi:phospholipid/cholesterol/gamma-HCH transport system permease protein
MLNTFFSIFGLAGSYLVAIFFIPMPPSIYFGNLLEILTLPDLLISIIKSLGFGMLISMVAVSHGLAVERASTEIPVAGLKSVGAALGCCVILDILLSALYYMLNGF